MKGRSILDNQEIILEHWKKVKGGLLLLACFPPRLLRCMGHLNHHHTV
jgi:hypothetical protein